MLFWRRPVIFALAGFFCRFLAAGEKDLDHLNLPEALRQKVADRKIIDRELELAWPVEGALSAPPLPEKRRRATERSGVVVLRQTNVARDELALRAALPEKTAPLRGYRAQLSDGGPTRWNAMPPANLSERQRKAASIISDRLAFDGLLPTLVQVITALGPESPDDDSPLGAELARIGFPTDLLTFFAIDGKEALQAIQQQLKGGAKSDSLPLSRATFNFRPSHPGFRAIAENGELPLRTLRLQLRGGYEGGGFLPGASLDFAENLLKSLPDVEVIASIERTFAEFVRLHAATSWDLRRRGQLTLISEPLPVSAWARDNGVSGIIQRGSTNAPALLAPRYASTGEAESLLLPGESFLMDGLAQAGLKIIQSPLLFQGGNMLMVHEPGGPRTILLSEREVARNVALGLSTNQVREAVQAEFEADRVVVLPTCSYHLDYDITLKTVDDKIVALVNDPEPAAATIVQLGMEALVETGLLNAAQADEWRKDVRNQQWKDLVTRVKKLFENHKTAKGDYSAQLCNSFRAAVVDAPGANLRTFLMSLDLLSGAPEKPAYSKALARMFGALEDQRATLRALGWRVVPIPSMPDLRWGANYINGVHGSRRYLMPACGGFYSKLDQVAETAIRSALGESVQIIPLLCAEMQRHYGAIHCMVSVLPDIP